MMVSEEATMSLPSISKKIGNILILFLCVDDMIYTRNMLLDEFKVAMTNEFEMKDLGLMKYFLCIEVKQSDDVIFISQQKYVSDVLKFF